MVAVHEHYDPNIRHYYLYSVFRQFCFHGQHLSGINIRVVRFVKGLFQLLQLIGREYGSVETGYALWIYAASAYASCKIQISLGYLT